MSEHNIQEKQHYLELAKFQQDCHANRQKYEWRLNLAFWAGLALLVYYSKKDGIEIFSACNCYAAIGAITAVLGYGWNMILIRKAHDIDAAWRLHYLKLAEGESSNPPKSSGSSGWEWTAAQFAFTLGLLLISTSIMLS